MQKAQLIISDMENRLVDAEECDESYFSKGLQCPTCKGLVFWKPLHIRYVEGNEQIVRATFAHSPSAPSNCPERNNAFDNYRTGATNASNSLYQNSEKYEKAVLDCLHYHQASKITYYHQKNLPEILDNKSLAIQVFVNERHLDQQIYANRSSEKIYSDPNLFIEAASKVLNSDQAFRYLEAKAKKLKHKSNQKDNVVTNIENLIGIVGYLQNGGSDKFRQQFICKAVLGSPKLSIPTNRLWKHHETKTLQDWLNLEIVCDEQFIENQRFLEVKIIKSFEMVRVSLKNMCNKPQFLADKLKDFEKDPTAPKNKFVRFVLSRTWDSIKNCDWSIVPTLYAW